MRAFQVEAALQGNTETAWRIPEALISTTALADLALETAVARAAERDGPPLDRETGTIPKDQREGVQTRIRELVEAKSEWKTHADWFPDLLLDGRINTMGAAGTAWRIWLSGLEQDSAAIAAANAIQRLERFIRKRRIRYFRNLLAHRSLSDTRAPLLEAAKPWMPDGETETLGPLWLRLTQSGEACELEPGAAFLAAPLVTAVFAALGIHDPAERYRRLLGAAMDALRAPVEVAP